MAMERSVYDATVKTYLATIGRRGGKTRAKNMTDSELSEAASKAGKASGKIRSAAAKARRSGKVA